MKKIKSADLPEMNDYEKSIYKEVSEYMEEYPNYSFDPDLNEIIAYCVVDYTYPLLEQIEKLKQFQTDGDGWVKVDIEAECYPVTYKDYWLYDIGENIKIGILVSYGEDMSNAEWVIENDAYPFDYVTHYMKMVPPSKPKQ